MSFLQAPRDRYTAASLPLFAGVCPGAAPITVVRCPIVPVAFHRHFSRRFLPLKLRDRLAHSIQLLGRTMAAQLAPFGPLPPPDKKKLIKKSPIRAIMGVFLLAYSRIISYFWIQKKTASKTCLFCPALLTNGINRAIFRSRSTTGRVNVHRPGHTPGACAF